MRSAHTILGNNVAAYSTALLHTCIVQQATTPTKATHQRRTRAPSKHFILKCTAAPRSRSAMRFAQCASPQQQNNASSLPRRLPQRQAVPADLPAVAAQRAHARDDGPGRPWISEPFIKRFVIKRTPLSQTPSSITGPPAGALGLLARCAVRKTPRRRARRTVPASGRCRGPAERAPADRPPPEGALAHRAACRPGWAPAPHAAARPARTPTTAAG